MTASDSSVGGKAGQFHTTRWTLGVGTVKTFVPCLPQRYLAMVREEVARTVSDPAEIEGEVRALCDALIATEGLRL